MSRERHGLLRWYPRRWRARYQDEMLALLDDQLGADRAPLRLRLSLCGHGLAERARELRQLGNDQTREGRRRDGSLLVLMGWAVFMIGGAVFAKAAEHFDVAVPTGSRLLPEVAFKVVAIGGVLGGGLMLAGAALALPAFIARLRTRDIDVVKPHVRRAITISALTVAATLPLLVWAHRLNDAQRNGANAAYSAAFIVWAALCVLTLAAWTAVAVTSGRHVDLRSSILRVEAVLASAVTATMLIVFVASIIWTAGMATAAPTFLRGGSTGAPPSALHLPASMPLGLAEFLMLAATAIGLAGAARIHRSGRPAPEG